MTALTTARTRNDLRARVDDWRAGGRRIALVPTMGSLHEGHLSLIRLARSQADRVVASLFVNPAQFAAGEDFEAYPRDEGRDARMLAQAGCDLLYAPEASEVYPPNFRTTVSVAGIGDSMEGAVRPSHFAGVATVVAKLLIQCGPDIAVFGEKDFQQLRLIERLAIDLDLPVKILAAPIARDADGLALSSRNAYLTDDQRQIAPALNLALRVAASMVAGGARVDLAERQARRALAAARFDAVDYLEVRAVDSLQRLGPGPIASPARLLAAARLGVIRLLDNVAI